MEYYFPLFESIIVHCLAAWLLIKYIYKFTQRGRQLNDMAL